MLLAMADDSNQKKVTPLSKLRKAYQTGDLSHLDNDGEDKDNQKVDNNHEEDQENKGSNFFLLNTIQSLFSRN